MILKKLLLPIGLILFPLLASAQNKNIFVTSGCANNGTGSSASCASTPGGAGAYNSCANFVTGEVAANANLVTMAGDLIVEFGGTSADTTACVVNGFTTSAAFLIRFQSTGANRHSGIWNTGLYRLTNAGIALQVQDPNFELFNLQIETTGTGTGNYRGLLAGSGSLEILASGNIFKAASCNLGGGGSCFSVLWRTDTLNSRCIFINNVGIQPTVNTSDVFRIDCSANANGDYVVIYNNTAYGGSTGFKTHGAGSSDAQYVKNNVSNGSFTTAYDLAAYGSFTTSVTNNNVSNDSSSPNVAYRSKTCSFTSTTGGSENLHLLSGDTNCKDSGADLSADAQYSFSTDIDNQTRTGAWDIGADEIVGGAANRFMTLLKVGL